LEEEDPLLNSAQLSYEVYWLLRKNPTLFASHYVRENLDLDAGIFFKDGKRQSTYCDVVLNGVTTDCTFDANQYVEYCKGKEPKSSILCFGIGGADKNEYSLIRNQNQYKDFYKSDPHWLVVKIDNEVFEATTKFSGGEKLWEIAKIIAREAKAFSDILKKEIPEQS
jgi:hypothetical protein